MNRGFRILIWLGLLLNIAFAQDLTTYRLQPEDIIRIQIYNEVQVNAPVQVGRDGNISAPFVGIVRAQGKTVSELEADLAKEYITKLRLRDPRVSVTIERFRQLRASVGGAVQRPGVFPDIRPTDTVVTLLNYAGGPISDRADLRRARLKKANTQEWIPVDLYAILIQGNLSQNYAIDDGDELVVPEDVKNRVQVIGAVQRPGTIPYREPLTVMDALGLAGGEVRYRSWLSHTYVLRESKSNPGKYDRIEVNLIKFIRDNDATQNIGLKSGDIVYVPDTKFDPNQISQFASAIANGLFILDRFGLRIFGGR